MQLTYRGPAPAGVAPFDATVDSLSNIPFAVLPPGLVEGNRMPYAPEWRFIVEYEL